MIGDIRVTGPATDPVTQADRGLAIVVAVVAVFAGFAIANVLGPVRKCRRDLRREQRLCQAILDNRNKLVRQVEVARGRRVKKKYRRYLH